MSEILQIKCLSANLTRDTQTFSNMDPYVVIQCGSQKRKTRTHQQGGKRPQWNDQFTFTNPKSNQIKFTVWDQDMMTDDKVGQGSVDITKFLSNPNVMQTQYITLTYKGRPAGKLNVQITYKSNKVPGNNISGNNNSQGWNANNNSQGWNNNNSQGWNTNNSQGWGINNNSQGWNSNNNSQGWNANNNTTGNNGWNTQNNLNNNTTNTNQQGWGSNNNNNSNGWNNMTSNNQPNITNPTHLGYQLVNNPALQKKPSSNNQSNPYGNISTEQNDANLYPNLNQNNKNIQNNYPNQNNFSNPNNPNIQNNPLMAMMGAKLFGEGPKQPQNNQNNNAFNILSMAVQGGVKQQPPLNNMGGWGQPGSNWGQPQNNWGQKIPPQNMQNMGAWGQNPQGNTGWGQQNKGSGWGSGW